MSFSKVTDYRQAEIVEHVDGDGRWLFCHVCGVKPNGVLEVQIPNPRGLCWRVDLKPSEYTIVK